MTAFRITPLSSKSLFHFLLVVSTIMDFNVAVMANDNSFPIARYHELHPSWWVSPPFVSLFDVFQFPDVVDVDFLRRPTQFAFVG